MPKVRNVVLVPLRRMMPARQSCSGRTPSGLTSSGVRARRAVRVQSPVTLRCGLDPLRELVARRAAGGGGRM